jgi:type II secretory pathway pseudopilin PulG
MPFNPPEMSVTRLLLRIVAVLAVALLVVVGGFLRNAHEKGKVKTTFRDMAAIRWALDSYHEASGEYPLYGGPVGAILPILDPFVPPPSPPCPPATRSIPKGLVGTDGWGNDIQYLSSGKSFALWSLGSDGTADRRPAQGFYPSGDFDRDIVFFNDCEWSQPEGLHANPCEPGVPFPITLVREQLLRREQVKIRD